MAEYILRDQAIIAVTGAKLPDVSASGLPIANGKRSVTDCVRRLKEIPAADVRLVVLCRDCIHLSGVTNGGSFFRCDRYDRWQDESNRVYMPLDGFCCYGQKKEEES